MQLRGLLLASLMSVVLVAQADDSVSSEDVNFAVKVVFADTEKEGSSGVSEATCGWVCSVVEEFEGIRNKFVKIGLTEEKPHSEAHIALDEKFMECWKALGFSTSAEYFDNDGREISEKEIQEAIGSFSSFERKINRYVSYLNDTMNLDFVLNELHKAGIKVSDPRDPKVTEVFEDIPKADNVGTEVFEEPAEDDVDSEESTKEGPKEVAE